jgi:predicted metal-dependent phosphoesterase TrpH
MMKIDLHVHTRASHDGMSSLAAIIKSARRRGLTGLAITDHNVLETERVLEEEKGFRLIRGEEVETSEGEIIGLFLTRPIPPGLSPAETLAAIKEQGGVAYLPHPWKRVGRKIWSDKSLARVLPAIDVIEVFNGRLLDEAANLQAARLARETGALPGAGSDAHTAWEVGRAFVEMPDFDSPTSFLDGLRAGKIFGRSPSRLIRILLNRFVRRGLRGVIPSFERRWQSP